ncbi:type II toxin-antitoxin system death-on-curing family toxin [Actinokineospora sp. UTMC 2448]|uniref:type II toxin-antitoxin system death-on-curing family toxin n=1 Tax=Actinokineospora sp. UTMC 2448 TaxID=2268449 RepID=UPI00216404C6|nr:Fic family protein [Actinokineospora sp. UTMC 2448]UVS81782.1 Death on curing protein [Actinokineospora sp. UTMC 2448]
MTDDLADAFGSLGEHLRALRGRIEETDQSLLAHLRPNATRYLDADDLLVLASAVVSEDLVVDDLGVIYTAVLRPQAVVMGMPAYDTLWLKAAALLEAIVRGKPLREGNWRLAWVAAVTFCDLNGHRLDTPMDEALDLVREVAAGMVDIRTLAERLQDWAGVERG